MAITGSSTDISTPSLGSGGITEAQARQFAREEIDTERPVIEVIRDITEAEQTAGQFTLTQTISSLEYLFIDGSYIDDASLSGSVISGSIIEGKAVVFYRG